MKSAVLLLFALPICAQFGVFEGRSDIGVLQGPGTAVFDSAAKSYRLSAGGETYVWTKVSGDISIAANIAFATAIGDPHKKAALLIRQSLDVDAAYAEVAVHGDGLTSLQTRETKGAGTAEIQSNVTRPSRVRITKDGDNLYISVAAKGQPLRFAGGALRAPLTGSFYIGLAVCANNAEAFETAVFSEVEITPLKASPKHLYSTLETMTVDSTDRRVVYVTEDPLPNPPAWSSDGTTLSFFNLGRAFEVPITGGSLANRGPASSQIEIGLSSTSPDGRHIVTLTTEPGMVQLRLTNSDDSGMITLAKFPNGATSAAWSPDGKRLAFISYQSIRE